MTSKRSILLYMFLFLFHFMAEAQEHNFIGTVKNEQGQGIADAFILLSDTTWNNQSKAEYSGIVSTDSLGNFSIAKDVLFHKDGGQPDGLQTGGNSCHSINEEIRHRVAE